MKNMKIRTKLLTGFVLVALLAMVVGVLGIYGLYSLTTSETVMYYLGSIASDISDVNANLQAQRSAYTRVALKQILDMSNTADMAELERLHTDFLTLYDNIVNQLEHVTAQKAQCQTYLNEAYSIYTTDYHPKVDILIAAAQSGDYDGVTATLVTLAAPIEALESTVKNASQYCISELDSTNVTDQKTADRLMVFSVVLAVVAVGSAIGLGLYIAGIIATPITGLVDAAHQMAQGDVELRLNINTRDEIGTLAGAFAEMAQGFQDEARTLNAMADGDYSVTAHVKSDKDVVGIAIARILDSNNTMLAEIRAASGQVAAGSTQIAQGAQALASGSTQQASSIEELSASIAEILNQSQSNTKIAEETFADTRQAGTLMEESMGLMSRMTAAMQAINDSARKIAQVIGVIDGIASQTNILALNAAVEAARAGQHGKGFAVVAEEVRNLAGKSAQAAKETAALIEDSIQKVAEGNSLAATTNTSLFAVGEISARNAKHVSAINEASQRQSIAIGEITQGMNQISAVVQTNSATSEESAASAQEMSAQAQMLSKIVSRFRLRDGQKGAYAGEVYGRHESDTPMLTDSAFVPSDGNKYHF